MIKLTEKDYKTLNFVFDIAKDALENMYSYVCSTNDVEEILNRIEKVKKILQKNITTF